jgi:hypothetical protein
MTKDELENINNGQLIRANVMCTKKRVSDASLRLVDISNGTKILQPSIETAATLQSVHDDNHLPPLYLPEIQTSPDGFYP